MSEAYAGMSDQDIIAQQAASMNSKENYQTKDKYQPRADVISEQSNVNEDAVSNFPGAQVNIGRTGQTGGGTNSQIIPPEEGGLERSQLEGESSDRFEGEGEFGGIEEKRKQALMNNPGSFDSNPRDIDQPFDRSKNEVIPITQGQELQPGQGIVADQSGQGSRADMDN